MRFISLIHRWLAVLHPQAFALLCLSFLLRPYNVLLSEILPVPSDLMCFWIFCSRKLYFHFTLYHRILLAIIHFLFWSETDQNLKFLQWASIFIGNFPVAALRTLLMQRQIQGEGWGGSNPAFGKFSSLSGYPCLSLFHNKNNTMSYNISFSPIDHYKKTVAIPLLDSLIIQMQDRFFPKIATPAICFVWCHRL